MKNYADFEVDVLVYARGISCKKNTCVYITIFVLFRVLVVDCLLLIVMACGPHYYNCLPP